MNDWIRKDGYDTCLQATADNLNTSGTEVHLIRFREGKFSHYHKETTEFFYFTAGTGRVMMDDRERRLYPGVTILVQPRVMHTFMNDSADELLEAIMVKTNIHPEDTYPA
jgi:mannose-6-phosphate isomerase-like protein (cupin superfamily)